MATLSKLVPAVKAKPTQYSNKEPVQTQEFQPQPNKQQTAATKQPSATELSSIPASAIAQTRIFEVTEQYLGRLTTRLNRLKFYPRTSQRLGEEGTVVVKFVIQRNGNLTDLSIVKSSGYKRLDQAALTTLMQMSPFEAIPKVIRRNQWSISVPLIFKLQP